MTISNTTRTMRLACRRNLTALTSLGFDRAAVLAASTVDSTAVRAEVSGASEAMKECTTVTVISGRLGRAVERAEALLASDPASFELAVSSWNASAEARGLASIAG